MVAVQTIEIRLPYQGLITAALLAIAAAPPALFILHPGVNRAGDVLLHEGMEVKVLGRTLYKREPSLQPQAGGHSAPNAHVITPMPVGSTVAGYRVTSGYGARPRPCPGCSSYHPAIDVATPKGTPLYAPGNVEVTCKSDLASGNYAEFDYQGMTHQWLHLHTCTPGPKSFGEQFAATGSTGVGTGPHLDYRVRQGGQRVYPPKEVLVAALDPSAFKQAPAPTAEADPTITDDTLKRAICRAEGTCDRNGNPNHAYNSHTDPGNRKRNQGFFSYQHGASSPEEADQKQLARLRVVDSRYIAQAQAKFGERCSRACMVAWLDAFNQSPDAGNRFIKFLATADPTPQQLIEARAAALAESRRLVGAPSPMNVPADQKRRVDALLEQVK